MTKKHFVAIATALRLSFSATELSESEKNTVLGIFTGELMRHNPRFDAERFRKAVVA